MPRAAFPHKAIQPCLPKSAKAPPTGPEWIHEIKHDGFRILARRDGDRVRLYTRNGSDFAGRFPRIVEAVKGLPAQSCFIDGEAIVVDDNGLAAFDLLRSWRHDHAAVLCAFDMIELDGKDLRWVPIEERKHALANLLYRERDGIVFNQHYDGDGAVIFKQACTLGCEGIVSKRLGSTYRSGRVNDWLKIKNRAAPAVKREAEEELGRQPMGARAKTTMGEAKVKRRRHAAVLAAHPWCIYCGGIHTADTIEHMPPIAIFDDNQRPKGLEFPACRDCNNGTRLSDTVASLLARAYPDAPKPNDLERLLRGVRNNIPGLLEEMHVGGAGHRNTPSMPAGAGVLRVNGPILTKHIDVFGAKLGLALHFEAHGSSVPQAGGVQTMFFTNTSALRGELPNELIRLMPMPRTLTQGKRSVGDQFKYSWALTEEKRHSVFYATFRQSFAIAAVTALDRSEFLERNAHKYPITIPGAFKAQMAPNA